MNTRPLRYTVLSLLLATALWGCGPSYVGVRTGPAYGPAYGYYGPRPFYGYRPPVYVVPPPRVYYNRPYFRNPNFGYRYNNPRAYGRGWGGSRGRW